MRRMEHLYFVHNIVSELGWMLDIFTRNTTAERLLVGIIAIHNESPDAR